MAVDYRLSSQISPAWPGVFEDVCRAFHWLIAQAPALSIDTRRLGVIGDSAGGHMAAMLSVEESTAKHMRAVVGVYGIYDLPDWWRVTQPAKRTDDPVRKLMGKSLPEAKEEYENFSPRHRVKALNSRPNASYLIIHGDEDAIVHHNQSEAFIAALQEKNADVETLLVPGAGHHWFTLADDNPARRRVDTDLTSSPILSAARLRLRGGRQTPRPQITSRILPWPRLCSSAKSSKPSGAPRSGPSLSIPWTVAPWLTWER